VDPGHGDAAQRVVVVVLGVLLLTEPLVLVSVLPVALPVVPVAEPVPEAPIEVPLPEVVSVLLPVVEPVPDAVVLPEPVVDVSAPAVAGGVVVDTDGEVVVVDEEEVEAASSRLPQADSDSAAIRARAAQRARGVVIIRKLLEQL
jgi:hypothetical protein